jgi:hypothetical protein
MKFSMRAVIALAISFLGLACATSPSATTQLPSGTAERAPVLVELFTSEGCSSCPPADALLARLEDEQPVRGAEVIALEQHVDYWNHLGWTDPFSSHEYSARQEEYAAGFGNSSAYTPQMVVDGKTEFVGSSERQARQTIEQAAAHKKADVAVTEDKPAAGGDQPFTVGVGKLTGATAEDTAEVWLAVTERGLHSDVTRGENAGEDLHHSAVVRTLRKIGVADGGKKLSFAADPAVKFAASWKKENLRVVVFVQEKKSRRILGAAAVRVTP